MWLLVLPANTARSRRGATLLLSGDGAVCWNDAVNASCITLDSCGKADDPHNLEGRALHGGPRWPHLEEAPSHLDACWDVAAQEAGNSQAHPVNLG